MSKWASQMARWLKNQPPNAGDVGLIHGLGRSLGVERGKPLQYPLDFPGLQSLGS